VKEDVPPGGCMPIGLTASGEIVFPIQCKEFIERQRGTTVQQKPAVVEEKATAKQSESVAPESGKPAIQPVEIVPFPKRRERGTSSDDGYSCQRYRTYDPESGTYTGYDGRRLLCR
jgi:hypothetical protein